MKINPNNLALVGTIAMLKMEMSLPVQQEILSDIDDRICEIREAIISGDKTADEMNALLDELQKLTIDKRSVESRISTIKNVHRKVKERKELEEKVQTKLDFQKLLPQKEL